MHADDEMVALAAAWQARYMIEPGSFPQIASMSHAKPGYKATPVPAVFIRNGTSGGAESELYQDQAGVASATPNAPVPLKARFIAAEFVEFRRR